MVETLEQKLRKHEHLVGTHIRLQDGCEWVFPACPLEGPASDAITALLVKFSALGDEAGPADSDVEGQIAAAKDQNKLVLDLAHAALQINYPELAREQLVERITKAHILPIVRAVNGIAELTELMGPMRDDDPIRPAGN